MLLLVRHGQSVWNASDRFAGCTDITLTDEGREEARALGRWLADAGHQPTRVYTSALRRAIETADLALAAAGAPDVRAVRTPVLDERHYGALQGVARTAAVRQYGAEQVARWRRTVDARPPLDAEGRAESLADVRERVAPFVRDVLLPAAAAGQQVMVVSHGNTMRMLSQLVEGLSDEEACALELPTGQPRICRQPTRPTVSGTKTSSSAVRLARMP